VATTSSWLATVGVPVAGLAMLVVLSVFAGAIIRVIATAITGEASGFRPGYRFGIARLGSLLLVSALVWLSVTAGCLLLVLPGIYVGVQLAASIPALVVEGRRGRSALARSWRLVEGQWWHAFGTIVLAWLVLGLVSAVIKVVVHAVTGPFGLGGWLVQALPVAVAALLLVPYGAAVLVVLYLDLRARKERVDLEVLTADLRASAA
jgi:hypothetical protein